MPTLHGPFLFLGTMGDINAYKIAGSDKTYTRAKPGPTKNQIKNDPSFVRTRENNNAWGGCSKFSAEIRHAAGPLERCMNPYISGILTGLGKKIEKLDTEGNRGERAIYISRARQWLKDYDLNRDRLFNSVVRNPLTCDLSREDRSVTVEIPELIPGIHLVPGNNYPVYRISLLLAEVSDIILDTMGYTVAVDLPGRNRATFDSGWHSTRQKRVAQEVKLNLKTGSALTNHQSLILYASIEWGAYDDINQISPVPKKGSAKIVALV